MRLLPLVCAFQLLPLSSLSQLSLHFISQSWSYLLPCPREGKKLLNCQKGVFKNMNVENFNWNPLLILAVSNSLLNKVHTELLNASWLLYDFSRVGSKRAEKIGWRCWSRTPLFMWASFLHMTKIDNEPCLILATNDLHT